jgi:hypothetical protein
MMSKYLNTLQRHLLCFPALKRLGWWTQEDQLAIRNQPGTSSFRERRPPEKVAI